MADKEEKALPQGGSAGQAAQSSSAEQENRQLDKAIYRIFERLSKIEMLDNLLKAIQGPEEGMSRQAATSGSLGTKWNYSSKLTPGKNLMKEGALWLMKELAPHVLQEGYDKELFAAQAAEMVNRAEEAVRSRIRKIIRNGGISAKNLNEMLDDEYVSFMTGMLSKDDKNWYQKGISRFRKEGNMPHQHEEPPAASRRESERYGMKIYYSGDSYVAGAEDAQRDTWIAMQEAFRKGESIQVSSFDLVGASIGAHDDERMNVTKNGDKKQVYKSVEKKESGGIFDTLNNNRVIVEKIGDTPTGAARLLEEFSKINGQIVALGFSEADAEAIKILKETEMDLLRQLSQFMFISSTGSFALHDNSQKSKPHGMMPSLKYVLSPTLEGKIRSSSGGKMSDPSGRRAGLPEDLTYVVSSSLAPTKSVGEAANYLEPKELPRFLAFAAGKFAAKKIAEIRKERTQAELGSNATGNYEGEDEDYEGNIPSDIWDADDPGLMGETGSGTMSGLTDISDKRITESRKNPESTYKTFTSDNGIGSEENALNARLQALGALGAEDESSTDFESLLVDMVKKSVDNKSKFNVNDVYHADSLDDAILSIATCGEVSKFLVDLLTSPKLNIKHTSVPHKEALKQLKILNSEFLTPEDKITGLSTKVKSLLQDELATGEIKLDVGTALITQGMYERAVWPLYTTMAKGSIYHFLFNEPAGKEACIALYNFSMEKLKYGPQSKTFMLYAIRNGIPEGKKNRMEELGLGPGSRVLGDPVEFTKKLMDIYFSSTSNKAPLLYQEMRKALSGIIVSVRKRIRTLYEDHLKKMEELLASLSVKPPRPDHRLTDSEKLQQIKDKDRSQPVSKKTVQRGIQQLQKNLSGQRVNMDPELQEALEQSAREGMKDLGIPKLAASSEDDIMLLIRTANSKLLAN